MYVNLHAHSVYSKDGFGPMETMVQRSKELGLKAMALTDHGTVSGFIEFKQLTEQYDIKPIFGIEGYLSPDPNADKIRTNHITILARNKVGYSNLIQLNNRSHEQMIVKRGNLKFPLITFADMKEFREGLIVLTGCPASMLYDGDYDYAATYVENLIRIFGDENVHPEIMFTLDGHDYHTRPLQVAAEFGLEPVITNDTHFTYKEDAENHMICTSIRSRAVTGSDYSYDNRYLYVKSEDEMREDALKHIDISTWNWCLNTVSKIADTVEDINLKHDVVVPYVSDEELKQFKDILNKKLEEYIRRNSEHKNLATQRFQKEVKIIDDFDFWSYFYIINDMVWYCHKHNRFTTARGSAGGSFLIYLLGIFDVDPLRYNLLFERFLNAARKDYPDVDLDVDSTFREQLVQYCEERWGLKSVNTTITFGHRSLIRDLSSYLEIEHDTVIWLQDLDPGSDEFAKYTKDNPAFARLYEMMIDQPKTVGTHAAALASIENDLPIPVEAWGNSLGIAFSESGMLKVLSYIGGLKFDVLGLNTLARLFNMYELTGVLPPEDIDSDFPAEIFADGKTLGIFQFDGSAGIQQMCRDIKPKSLEELATINSMYRPGALDAGTAEHYLEYKKKPRKFHPDIDPILAPTYSVIVYQEQVMDIYATITGEGLEGADIARRILSPKNPKMLENPKWQKDAKEVKENFFAKGLERKYSKKLLEDLWSELITHSRYSFNKSHSIGYAAIAAKQAWYKKYHPSAFYIATLNALLEDGKTDQMQDYVYYLALEGITVRPPSVVHSSDKFVLNNNEIYLPITVVKWVSERSLEALNALKAIINNEPYSMTINGEDYYTQLVQNLHKYNITEINADGIALLSKGHIWNKRAKENLYLVGALDDLPGDLTKLVNCDILDRQDQTQCHIDSMTVTLVTDKIMQYKRHADKHSMIFGFITKKIRKTNRSGKPVVILVLTDNTYIRFYEWHEDTVNDIIKLEVGTPVIAVVNEWGYLQFYKDGKPRINKAF